MRLLVHCLHVRPSRNKVLICEPLAGSKTFREALNYVLFRWLRVPAIVMAPSLEMPLYTAGAETGLVVDVGFRESHVLAVAFGRPLLHTYAVVGMGALTLLDRARELLESAATAKKEGGGLSGQRGDRLPLELLQDIVTRACFVVGKEDCQVDAESIAYEEKGFKLTLTPELRSTVAEGLFAESVDDGESLPIAVLECLRRCPRDVRRLLASHVLVSGGVAMLPGFCPRLAEEVKQRARVRNRYQELCPLLLGYQGTSRAHEALAPSAHAPSIPPPPASSRASPPSPSALCLVAGAALLAPRNVLSWVGGSIYAVLLETLPADASPFLLRGSYMTAVSTRGRSSQDSGEGQGGRVPVLQEGLSTAGGRDVLKDGSRDV